MLVAPVCLSIKTGERLPKKVSATKLCARTHTHTRTSSSSRSSASEAVLPPVVDEGPGEAVEAKGDELAVDGGPLRDLRSLGKKTEWK